MELDGYLHFTDSKGNNQILYPAILEPDLLLRNLQSIDSSATLGIQSDGTASIRIQGQTGVWVADLVLSDVPVAKTQVLGGRMDFSGTECGFSLSGLAHSHRDLRSDRSVTCVHQCVKSIQGQCKTYVDCCV